MDRKPFLGHRLEIVVHGVELFVAGVLVFMAAFGAAALVYQVYALVIGGVQHPTENFIAVLDFTLLIFVIAELFKIALAYIRREDVIPTVMEAGLVAVARKIVVLDTHVPAMELLAKCGSYALLLVAVGLSWYLLAKTNPRMAEVPHEPDSDQAGQSAP